MKKLLLIIIVTVCFIACLGTKETNSLKQLEDFIQKIEQDPTSDVCSEGITLVTNSINSNGYQKNVLQIIDLLTKIPQIKQCKGYNTIEETLRMAVGYKNVPWGSSLETVRKAFGKMRFVPWDEYDIDGYGIRFDLFLYSPGNAFENEPRQLDWNMRKYRQAEAIQNGQVPSSTVKMYSNKEGYFFFYKNNFFAYLNDLPWPSGDDKLYFRNLCKKYGKGVSRTKEIYDGELHMWSFGNTYILLRNTNRIIYLDKVTLDKLNEHYKATQAALRAEAQAAHKEGQRKAQAAANSL